MVFGDRCDEWLPQSIANPSRQKHVLPDFSMFYSFVILLRLLPWQYKNIVKYIRLIPPKISKCQWLLDAIWWFDQLNYLVPFELHLNLPLSQHTLWAYWLRREPLPSLVCETVMTEATIPVGFTIWIVDVVNPSRSSNQRTGWSMAGKQPKDPKGSLEEMAITIHGFLCHSFCGSLKRRSVFHEYHQ